MNKKLLAGPYVFWAIMFILIPLGMVFYYGLTDKTGAFTLENVIAIANKTIVPLLFTAANSR